MTHSIYEEKVWGTVRHLFDDIFQISTLKTKAGFRSSDHYHKLRWNRFYVVSGNIDVVFSFLNEQNQLVETDRAELGPTELINVPPDVWHRFEIKEDACIVEIYWTDDGSIPRLDDIVRFNEGGRM